MVTCLQIFLTKVCGRVTMHGYCLKATKEKSTLRDSSNALGWPRSSIVGLFFFFL